MVRFIVALCYFSLVGALQNLRPDPCSCLDWQDAYQKHNVKCGLGHEMKLLGGAAKAFQPELKPVYSQFCTLGYERFAGTTCLKTEHMSQNQDYWCYVDSMTCKSRDLLHIENSTAAAKLCKKGKDDLASNHPISELTKRAQDLDMIVGLLLTLSYPMLETATWPEVEDWFLNGKNPKKLNHRALTELVRAKTPIIFDSGGRKIPHYIINGTTVQKVDITKYAHGHGFREHAGKWLDVFCVKDCGEARNRTKRANVSLETRTKLQRALRKAMQAPKTAPHKAAEPSPGRAEWNDSATEENDGAENETVVEATRADVERVKAAALKKVSNMPSEAALPVSSHKSPDASRMARKPAGTPLPRASGKPSAASAPRQTSASPAQASLRADHQLPSTVRSSASEAEGGTLKDEATIHPPVKKASSTGPKEIKQWATREQQRKIQRAMWRQAWAANSGK